MYKQEVYGVGAEFKSSDITAGICVEGTRGESKMTAKPNNLGTK